MHEIERRHAEMVEKLTKPGSAILDTLTAEKVDALHHVLGIAGEAGELVDQIKKWVIYDRELNVDNVIEELGDLEFYIEGLRATLGIHRLTTLAGNLDKLNIRYDGYNYSDEQAELRRDKK